MGLFDTMFEKIEQKKKAKEEQERIDRETVRNSAKTKALTEAICKAFLPDGFCFKQLCDPNVSSLKIEVLRWGIIAETFYRRKVGDEILHKDLLVRFSDLALNDLKNDAMVNELQTILLEELETVVTISINKYGYITLIKRTW